MKGISNGRFCAPTLVEFSQICEFLLSEGLFFQEMHHYSVIFGIFSGLTLALTWV